MHRATAPGQASGRKINLFAIANEPVKIHTISTGQVSVKTKFRDCTKFDVLDFIVNFCNR
jgi:hypothetical protein